LAFELLCSPVLAPRYTILFMLVLAFDTCDARGSIALVRDSAVLAAVTHPPAEEYSSWLIPAANAVLHSASVSHTDLEGYAVATGPGSFTGVRVGLTTVKAWSEVFAKPVAAVSRLEALASLAAASSPFVAAFIDAHRGQLFGALYSRCGERLERIEDELVTPPAAFLEWVLARASGCQIAWLSLDPQILTTLDAWKPRSARGERVESAPAQLASRIAHLGIRQIAHGRAADPLTLDANYVRRSDAELFSKKSAAP